MGHQPQHHSCRGARRLPGKATQTRCINAMRPGSLGSPVPHAWCGVSPAEPAWCSWTAGTDTPELLAQQNISEQPTGTEFPLQGVGHGSSLPCSTPQQVHPVTALLSSSQAPTYRANPWLTAAKHGPHLERKNSPARCRITHTDLPQHSKGTSGSCDNHVAPHLLVPISRPSSHSDFNQTLHYAVICLGLTTKEGCGGGFPSN